MINRNIYLSDSFEQGGSNMVPIRLTREDLGGLFSVDAHGRRLTLAQFIQGEDEMHQEEMVGSAGSAELKLASNEEPNFSAEDINDLVKQYLRSMGDDEVLEIVGSEPFDKEQLMKEVENRTSVGLQIIEMILADRGFVERQIKRGNYSYPD